MSSSPESEVLSERETQFVEQSGDEEVLWAVQEITAERGNKYKVKWAGVDPMTGKPWAQSWVAKHDCTDDLVIEWKKKRKKKPTEGKKRGRGTSTGSRTSGVSKPTGSVQTRRSTSKTTSSRVDSGDRDVVAPSKPSTTTSTGKPKRKRQLETLATTTASSSSKGVKQSDERERGESELARPRKKQRTIVDVLLPPISSDEEDVLLVPHMRVKETVKNKVPREINGPLRDEDGGEDSSLPKGKAKAKPERRLDMRSKDVTIGSKASNMPAPRDRTVHRDKAEAKANVPDRDDNLLPKAKVKSGHRLNVHSKDAGVSSKTSDEPAPQPRMEVKVVPRCKERVTRTVLLTSSEDEDENLRPPGSRIKVAQKRKSPEEQDQDLSEKEEGSTVYPFKTGPPRGVKRQETLKKSSSTGKLGPSRTKQLEDKPADELVPTEEIGHNISTFGTPLLLRQKKNASPPSHISIPPASTSRPRSPELSPGARARLELFDQMIADPSQPDVAPLPDVSEHVPDDGPSKLDDTHDTNYAYDTFDSLRPPKSKSKPTKPHTPNGLIVPETESSGNSQSQSPSQSLLKPPQPTLQPSSARNQVPRKPVDLPTIAVIAASATSSSASPQDPVPPQKLSLPTNRPSKGPTKFDHSTFRSTTNACPRLDDSEPPLSSIESFTSPKRVDKGKQKAVEEDELHISLSEGDEARQLQKKRTQYKVTDSQLKKRGKELFDQAQLARETEWQKDKKTKTKRLKTIDEIVNGGTCSSKASPLQLTSMTESTLELQMEDMVDLSGGANDTTLDTQEHGEARPLSEEKRERLRIELREEEEESTQEAMGNYPLPPVTKVQVMNGVDAQMPPPKSSKDSPFSGHNQDVDHIEQPSTDLYKASVIVQASQGQRYEDMESEPLPVNQLPSSPPRSIPENLTDSPKRRLGEALSLLNVKSEEIQRLEHELADERKSLQGLKAELAEVRQSAESTATVRAAWEVERAQWTQERTKWENDLSTWEAQRKETSEEMASLSARLAELSDAAVRAEEARVKLSELEVERVAWIKERDVMLNDVAQRSDELAKLSKVCGEHDQDRTKWEGERTLWDEEKARWKTERTSLQEEQKTLLHSVDELTTSLESMKAAKASAEKDKDFFREQYLQASEFVGSVRAENVELENRANIAEGQAQEGVAAIKALFEDRVKALQADVDRWKGLTELLQEKDRRTNDDLRLRAAQAPELVELCERLATENKSLQVDVRKLSHVQQRRVSQRNRLFYEILLLKKERASLKSKLAKLTKGADSSTNTQETSISVPVPPVLEDPENIDPNDSQILPGLSAQSLDASLDEPALFPCMWRPQWRDQCQQIFDTKEDLERHMQEHYRDLLSQ